MKKRTKVIAVVAASVLLAGTASGAFAYWTAAGNGAGSAVTSSVAPTALVANQVTVLTPMKPGDSAQLLSGNFTNPGTPAYVDHVTVSIGSVTVHASSGTCDATDFTLSNPVMTVNSEIASGSAVGSWSGASIKFNDKPGVAQDGCVGATLVLAYSID